MGSITNFLANATPVSLLGARQRGSGATNGTGQDVTAYEGKAIVTMDGIIESGTTPTVDVKLQESDTLGGTYTDIAGAVFPQKTTAGAAFLEKIVVDLDATKKFVRAVATNAGTSPVAAVSVLLTAQKKQLP